MRTVRQTQKSKPKIGYADATLFVLALASLGLIIWGVNIFRLTIIPIKYLFATVVFGTFICYPLIKHKLKPSYKTVWQFLISVVIGGGLLYFSILYLNARYSQKLDSTEILKIIRTGNLAGRNGRLGIPFAVINFNGMEKELTFPHEYRDTINTFSEIKIEYSRGFFGFEVIKAKSLLK